MDRHLNILQQLLEYWWDSDIDGITPDNKWNSLSKYDQREELYYKIYYYLKKI